MKIARFTSFAVGALSFLRSVDADAVDTAVNEKLAEKNVKGAAVAYYDGSGTTPISLARGYGTLGVTDTTAVTADTAFMLASVSKVFAAAAVTSLIDDGAIGLDDDICNTLPPDWKTGDVLTGCQNPDHTTTPVTWRMLVTHRSSFVKGIPRVTNSSGNEVEANYGPIGGYDGTATNDCPLTDVQGFYRKYLTNIGSASVGSTVTVPGGGPLNWYDVGQGNNSAWQNWKPGSLRSSATYSNFAYGYIAALVELKAQPDKTFEAYCQEKIFTPLKMTRTSWFRDSLGSNVAIPVDAEDGPPDDAGHYCFIEYSSGQLYSTANDLAKFLASMLNYGSPTLWNETLGRTSMSCQEKDTEENIVTSNCQNGIGWFVLDNSDDTKAAITKNNYKDFNGWLEPYKNFDWTNGVMHDGSELGVQSRILVLPSSKVYAAAVVNTGTAAGDAADELISLIATNAPGSCECKRLFGLLDGVMFKFEGYIFGFCFDRCFGEWTAKLLTFFGIKCGACD